MSDYQYVPKNVEEELKLREQQREYQGKAHRDVVTARLAMVLGAVFGASLLVHYAAVTVFAFRGNTAVVESLQSILHEWLPAFTGLLGAAVSYYFAGKK
jgi:hypothetical protein